MSCLFRPGLLFAALSLMALSCTPDPNLDIPEPKVPDPSPSILLRIHHQVDAEPLIFGQKWYQNENGDEYRVSEYRYYISHIQLIGQDGTIYSEPEIYHLVDAVNPESSQIRMEDLPPGSYNQLRFLIGVDSLRNVSGAQTGALDPAHGMFWTWNTGYIMAAMMGSSPQAGPIPENLSFHVGGFEGPHSAVRSVVLNLDQPVHPGADTVLDLYNNLNEWFRGPHLIDFSTFSNISAPGYGASMLADNYATMFSLKP